MALSVITPAADLQLLTTAELRTAAGLAADDTSQDASLAALGLEAAEWIATICGVAAADVDLGSPPLGPLPPTFKQEVLLETLVTAGHARSLTLSRRFVSDVSATLGGITVDAATYLVRADAGRLEHLSGGIPSGYWPIGTMEITYTAGFSTVPPVMKAVATDYIGQRYGFVSLDPDDRRVRSETTNDLDSVSYFDPGSSRETLEASARRRLSRFVMLNV